MKPHRTQSKNSFETVAVNADPFGDKGLVVNGRVFGNPMNAYEVNARTAIEFTEQILKRFTDYE